MINKDFAIQGFPNKSKISSFNIYTNTQENG